MDDYFYPYPVNGEIFPDSAAFAESGGSMTLGEWRRDNVNRMILRVRKAIREIKPWVRFGISPFGIWRNQSNDPEGSPTEGLDGYERISADSRRWLREGWVDYLSPQVYWEFEHPRAPYAPLVEWWHRNSTGRSHLFISQGLYKVGTQWRPHEIVDQIRLNRIFSRVGGTILFSARHIIRNTEGINDLLRSEVFQYPSLPPTYPWIDKTPPLSVDSLRVNIENGRVVLKWDPPIDIKGEDGRLRFAVYRSKGSPVSLGNPEGLVAVTSATSYSLASIVPSEQVYIGVTTLDRNGNQGRMNVRAIGGEVHPYGKEIPESSNHQLHLMIEPNPFLQFTLISFSVASKAFVRLTTTALPVGGRISLIERELDAGDYKTRFAPPVDDESTVYNVTLQIGTEMLNRTIQRIR